jgi:deoxyribodipyrimidine photo-lyase
VSLPSLPEGLDPDFLPLSENYVEQMPPVSSRSAIPFQGGEQAGLERLNSYLFQTQNLSQYKETRNGLVGKDYSSKLSLWLANGAISPRKIYAEIKRYEKEIKKNSSTYWLFFELVWRDFFRFTAMRYGRKFFYPHGISDVSVKYENSLKAFEKWCKGETGEAFVDANMKELHETGFMSNRGRQNVASYLTNDLKIDWRWGAYWFQYQLIDFDVCSNWGNWMYVAGVGNDPRVDRYFNIKKQADRYDSDGAYRKLWLGEIR